MICRSAESSAGNAILIVTFSLLSMKIGQPEIRIKLEEAYYTIFKKNYI